VVGGSHGDNLEGIPKIRKSPSGISNFAGESTCSRCLGRKKKKPGVIPWGGGVWVGRGAERRSTETATCTCLGGGVRISLSSEGWKVECLGKEVLQLL